VDLPDVLLPEGQILDMFDSEFDQSLVVICLMVNWWKLSHGLVPL